MNLYLSTFFKSLKANFICCLFTVLYYVVPHLLVTIIWLNFVDIFWLVWHSWSKSVLTVAPDFPYSSCAHASPVVFYLHALFFFLYQA